MNRIEIDGVDYTVGVNNGSLVGISVTAVRGCDLLDEGLVEWPTVAEINEALADSAAEVRLTDDEPVTTEDSREAIYQEMGR